MDGSARFAYFSRMRRALCCVLATLCVLALFTFARPAAAVDLVLNGAAAGPAVCPDGGTAVDKLCQVNATPSANNGCRYGGVHTFGTIALTNGATVCVTPYNGSDKVNTGDLVLKADTITIDATSRVTAKGSGYRGILCGDGEGPAALSGGRGGCSVLDSGGGGAHFGGGGRGTKDCFLVAPANSCQFPQELEEDCGDLAPGGGSCVGTVDPNKPVCYGTTNNANGAGDGFPTVAGVPYRHNILANEMGAAGGDKGCRDGFDNALRAGNGGGRIVLFASNAAQNGSVNIAGRVTADGFRGCSSGNDSAGGGAGGTILIVGDTVDIAATARISAHGARGGDSQPKCVPCSTNAECQSGQTCSNGRCGPCNCTPCTSNAQCNALLGQTCKNLGGDLGSVCADAMNQCTPFDPADNEVECKGTQNNGTCDDCGGGGGGGIINVQSRIGKIHPQAIFDVRGGNGGICPICAGEAGGGAGELQIDSAYVGEVCDGWDNDLNGLVDDGLGMISCPDGTMIPSCESGLPQQCTPDPALCTVQAMDARPRFALIVDTSGSMLNDLAGNPTFGDGSVDYPGVDTATDPDAAGGNNSRLFIAKQAVTQVLSAFPESDYALGRYYQDVGVNRSCQSASNFECAMNCCSYDDPTNNIAPPYPSTYPDNQCVLSQLYPAAGYPANASFTGDMLIGWTPEAMESPPTSDCINYAGSCGAPRRGAQFVVGFDHPIQQYLEWLDGVEDPDATFDATTKEGDHCPNGNCELRGTGPTPLAGALQATYDFLTPTVACDSAEACRPYSVILLTDGAESCDGDPAQAASLLLAGVSGKAVKTYVIGFSVLASEQTQLNQIAAAGGTGGAFFVQTKSELANALAQIIGSAQKFELCNDKDDDCDGMIDEDFPEKGQACDDGELGICHGTGAYQCKADGSGTECVITDPGAAPGVEVCNGMDDDCDGLVDEDDSGLPLDCPTCTPSPEICDGIDNDCDLNIDEEPDVSMNQPGTFGVPCEEPVAPNDLPPCKAGVVMCINAKPVCVGAVGPKPELCNGKDDDCDGIGDNEAVCPGDSKCVEGVCANACLPGEFPCAPGYTCVDGYCIATTCAGVTCPSGQVCQDGMCVDAGGGGGQGGSSGSAGSTQGGTSQGGTTSTGTGATAGKGGESNPKGAYGQATGGGGCQTGNGTTEGGALLALLGLAAAIRRRKGPSRARPSATHPFTTCQFEAGQSATCQSEAAESKEVR